MFTIGVDVGGTYTDLVATDETGRTVFAKSPSTPADQSIGVMAGLEELARRLNVTRADMLAATDRLVHGTTVATNALLERKGAKVALLDHRRPSRRHRNARRPQARPLRSALAAAGAAGAARTAFWRARAAQGERRGSRFRSTMLRSMTPSPASRNPARPRSRCASCTPTSIPLHEIAAVERLTRELPDISVSRSSDVLPQIKEYERVSTTIVNAYVEPIVRRYLTNLEARLTKPASRAACSWCCRMAAWRRSRKPRGSPRARCCRGRPAACPAAGAAPICSAFPIWCRSTWAAPAPTFR